MARPLVVQLGESEIALQLNKVDRARLYGSKEVEAVDDAGNVCELATLGDDGRTLIGKGGTGLGWLDADGKWADKAALKPVDAQGDEITPVGSSYAAPVKLFDTATAEQLLEHNIRLAYSIELSGDDASQELLEELNRGTIFTLPYSYRGGLEADVAFILLSEEGEPMLLVGNPTETTFVGIQSQLVVDEQDAEQEPDDIDAMNFDMI